MPKDLVASDGAVAWSASHSAYGRIVSTYADPEAATRYANNPVKSPFRLLGQVADDEAELCWTRFRCFDPETGTWMSTDPLEIEGGLNLYGFDGAPTDVVDPLGSSTDNKPHGGQQEDPALRNGWKPDPKKDLDWRGTGKDHREALDEAFRRTGVPKEDFEVTRWGRTKYGKSTPVEWRSASGAEVNMDVGHTNEGPGVPHVGYQTPGKRSSGGATRGHILLDDVPANR